MSTTVTPAGSGANTPKASPSAFDDKLNIAKSSKVIADYMRQTAKSAQITEISTAKKAELDSTKQRPQN
ncbi:hypothetical protein EJ576_10940 [Pseudomonas sp. C 49-2]|uniref:hypothetical protein n=1 Tax=Pseudomonas sp. C 49-2 TaxID=2496849 RepID=UPI000F82C570|nr:hypothetical protein [Pseudomonas sp. C 49-2]RTY00810.1 hypothetical protein EJ576_10940 [Pseudomonas sp. C 49-2]